MNKRQRKKKHPSGWSFWFRKQYWRKLFHSFSKDQKANWKIYKNKANAPKVRSEAFIRVLNPLYKPQSTSPR